MRKKTNYQRWIFRDIVISRGPILKVSVSSGSRNPKSRLDLGLRPLHLDSKSRQCGDVNKDHIYVICDKNRLFVRFFSHLGVMVLFKFSISHNRIEPWQTLCMAIRKPEHRIRCSKIIDQFLLTFKRLAFYIVNKKI